jgi:hypothetical protein
MDALRTPSTVCLTASLLLFVTAAASAQEANLANHEKRLQAVESYLETLPPSLTNYVGSLEESIQRYNKNLEKGLLEYSTMLEENLENRLLGMDRRRIELNKSSRTYQKIETPTGMFFISVVDIKPIAGGFRLYLNIGNPHYADFRDFTLRLVWGSRWNAKSEVTYQQWRAGLDGAEYKFNGRLERGTWSPVELDLTPAEEKDIAYIECEMGVESIELEKR